MISFHIISTGKLPTNNIRLGNKLAGKKKKAPVNRYDALEASSRPQEASQHVHHAHNHASFQEFYFCAPTPHPPVPIKTPNQPQTNSEPHPIKSVPNAKD